MHPDPKSESKQPQTAAGGELPEADPRLLPLALAFYAALLGVALLWRVVWQDASLLYADPDLPRDGLTTIRDALLGAGFGLLLVVVSRAWTRRSRSAAALARALREVIGRRSRREVWLLALSSGIAEEALFRGALQPNVGWLAASLLFGLAHLAPQRELRVWAPAALVAGFGLGALYAWTGGLLAPAVAHVVLNGCNLGWLAGPDPPGEAGRPLPAP